MRTGSGKQTAACDWNVPRTILASHYMRTRGVLVRYRDTVWHNPGWAQPWPGTTVTQYPHVLAASQSVVHPRSIQWGRSKRVQQADSARRSRFQIASARPARYRGVSPYIVGQMCCDPAMQCSAVQRAAISRPAWTAASACPHGVRRDSARAGGGTVPYEQEVRVLGQAGGAKAFLQISHYKLVDVG